MSFLEWCLLGSVVALMICCFINARSITTLAGAIQILNRRVSGEEEAKADDDGIF